MITKRVPHDNLSLSHCILSHLCNSRNNIRNDTMVQSTDYNDTMIQLEMITIPHDNLSLSHDIVSLFTFAILEIQFDKIKHNALTFKYLHCRHKK